MSKNVVQFIHKGDFNCLETFLVKAVRIKPIIRAVLDKYGKRGVEVLREATPKNTGKTADSWFYKIEEDQNGNLKISWHNNNMANNYVPIVILLRYGHATRNGGFVQGNDFITPAIDETFHRMANEAWKEVNDERKR